MKSKLNESLFLKINNLSFIDKNKDLIVNNFSLNIKKGEIHSFVIDDKLKLEHFKSFFIDELKIKNQKSYDLIFDNFGGKFSRQNLLLHHDFWDKKTTQDNLYYKFLKSEFAKKQYDSEILKCKTEIKDLENKIKAEERKLPKSEDSLKNLTSDFLSDEKKKFYSNQKFDYLKLKEELDLLIIKNSHLKSEYKRKKKFVNKQYLFNQYQVNKKISKAKQKLEFFQNINKAWYSLSLKEYFLIKKYSLDQRDFEKVKNEIKHFIRFLVSQNDNSKLGYFGKGSRMRLFLYSKQLESLNTEEKISLVWKHILKLLENNDSKFDDEFKNKILNFKNFINNLFFTKSIVNTKINRITYNYFGIFIRSQIKDIDYFLVELKKLKEEISLKNHGKYRINLFLADIKHYNYEIFILENLKAHFVNLIEFFNEIYFFYDEKNLKKFHKIVSKIIWDTYKKYENYYIWQKRSTKDRKKLEKYILKNEQIFKYNLYQSKINNIKDIFKNNKSDIKISKNLFKKSEQKLLSNLQFDLSRQSESFNKNFNFKKEERLVFLRKELKDKYKIYKEIRIQGFERYENILFDERLRKFLEYLNFPNNLLIKPYKSLTINEKLIVQLLNLLITDSRLVMIDDTLLSNYEIQLPTIIKTLTTLNQDYQFTILIFVNNLKFIQLFANRITLISNGEYLETITIKENWLEKLSPKSQNLLFYISKDSLKSHNFFSNYRPVSERLTVLNYQTFRNKKIDKNHVVYTKK